jgi:hypothetical protein
MERRRFVKLCGALCAVCSPLFTLAGCSFSSVYADILAYVPAALSAFSVVLSILSAAGITLCAICAGLVNTVKAAFADLQTAITLYDDAPQSGKTTLLGKISTALLVAEEVLQEFWSNLDIPDSGIAGTIEGIIQIILETLMGFQSAIPAPPAVTTESAAALHRRQSLAKTIRYTPTRRSLKQFKSAINAFLVTKGYSQYSI